MHLPFCCNIYLAIIFGYARMNASRSNGQLKGRIVPDRILPLNTFLEFRLKEEIGRGTTKNIQLPLASQLLVIEVIRIRDDGATAGSINLVLYPILNGIPHLNTPSSRRYAYWPP